MCTIQRIYIGRCNVLCAKALPGTSLVVIASAREGAWQYPDNNGL